MHNRCGCPSRHAELSKFPLKLHKNRKHQSWQIHSGPVRLFWVSQSSTMRKEMLLFSRQCLKKVAWLTNKRVSVYRVGFGQGRYLPSQGSVWGTVISISLLTSSPHSMLPLFSLNGGGHFKIGKLCVENSTGLPTVPSVLVSQNWLLFVVFSLKPWKVWPSAST